MDQRLSLLFDVELLPILFRIRNLREIDFQDAIVILYRSVGIVDIVDIEASFDGSIGTFTPNIVLLGLFHILFFLRGDDEIPVLVFYGDVLLIEARKIRLDHIGIVGLLDVDLELFGGEVDSRQVVENLTQEFIAAKEVPSGCRQSVPHVLTLLPCILFSGWEDQAGSKSCEGWNP
jgi:hypothetical protein